MIDKLTDLMDETGMMFLEKRGLGGLKPRENIDSELVEAEKKKEVVLKKLMEI